jgi:hypothetical protein
MELPSIVRNGCVPTQAGWLATALLGLRFLNRLRLQQFSADDWASVSDCYLCPKPQDHSCPPLRIAKKTCSRSVSAIFEYVFMLADTEERPQAHIASSSEVWRLSRQDLLLCRGAP